VPYLKPVWRLAYAVAWIILYFLLICIVSGYDILLWFTPWSFFLVPSTLLLLAGLALVLGLVTDHFCHTYFDWYAARSFEVFVVILVVLTGLVTVMYNSWYTVSMVGPPHFEKLAVIDVYRNNLTNLAVLVENVGNVEANITDIYINGEPVSSMNGTISTPKIPFILKTRGVQTIRLSFSSPLPSNVSYEVVVQTYIGSNYTGRVTIP
jgi:hypothetical protein